MAARFLHIFLAVVTLFSSTGVVLNSHVCQGNAKDMEMCSSSDGCDSGDDFSCANHRHHCDDNCCTNHRNYFKLKQDQQLTSFDFQVPVPQPNFIVAIAVPVEILPGKSQLWPSYLSFKPPIVEPDIWLKLETVRC